MKKSLLLLTAASVLAAAPASPAQNVSGPAFYGDPPDEHHPWAVHDRNRPQPPVVAPGTYSSVEAPGKPPSDAIVLFDGTDLSGWKSTKKGDPPKMWEIVDGAMQCVPGAGDIITVDSFGDCQLHVEWAAPAEVKGNSQGRGNSGIFLMNMAEVQVLDNYDNPSYADGSAGSIYGISPPLANALRPPGQFQVYDIVFRRPLFRDGEQIDPGYVTVFCNGVLLQDHTPLEGPGGHKGRSKPRAFPEKGPIRLQDHGNTVRYRNIWVRPLPPRTLEGGTDGRLTAEATRAKRAEIAASIREDATGIDGLVPKMLRLFESRIYDENTKAAEEAGKLAAAYAGRLGGLEPDALEERKGEIMQVRNAFNYLAKAEVIADDFAPRSAVEEVIEKQGWNEKK